MDYINDIKYRSNDNKPLLNKKPNIDKNHKSKFI